MSDKFGLNILVSFNIFLNRMFNLKKGQRNVNSKLANKA